MQLSNEISRNFWNFRNNFNRPSNLYLNTISKYSKTIHFHLKFHFFIFNYSIYEANISILNKVPYCIYFAYVKHFQIFFLIELFYEIT